MKQVLVNRILIVLGYDFRQNDTKLDLISHGPYAGIEITF